MKLTDKLSGSFARPFATSLALIAALAPTEVF